MTTAVRPRLELESRFATPAELAAAGRGRWRIAIPGAPIERDPPRAHGEHHPDLEARAGQAYPDLGVLELDGGFVVGRDAWIVTATGELVPELGWHGANHDEMRLPASGFRVRELAGTCFVLASDWSAGNYGHFLLDALGRVELLRRGGYRLEDADHIYCGFPHRGARRLLERLGIDPDEVFVPRTRLAVQAERLIATSFPGMRRDYPPWLVEFLRSELGPPVPEERRRRLYLPRTTKRRIANEADLLPILFEHGFEIYDPAANDDPPADFAEAEIVVGAHGAGLADIAFCVPGTQVLELVPSDHVYPYWFTLADAAGLRYGYLVGESHEHREPGDLSPSKFDFTVDPACFAASLKRIVGEAAAAG